MELKRRQKQLGEVLKQPIADFLRSRLDPQRFGLVTVIDVIVSANLAKVEIWISCLDGKSEGLEKQLQQYAPDLMRIAYRHIHLRREMHIAFRIAG